MNITASSSKNTLTTFPTSFTNTNSYTVHRTTDYTPNSKTASHYAIYCKKESAQTFTVYWDSGRNTMIIAVGY